MARGAEEHIAKFKAKFDPDVVFLRWKKTKDLAVLKYSKSAFIQALKDLMREAGLEQFNLKFPFSGRFVQYSRELEDLGLENLNLFASLWEKYSLPILMLSPFYGILKTEESARVWKGLEGGVELSPDVWKAPEVKEELNV